MLLLELARCLLGWLSWLSRLSLVGLMRPVTSTRVLSVGDSRAAVVSGWEEADEEKEAVEDEKGDDAEADVDEELLAVEAVDDAKGGTERCADLPEECLCGEEEVRGGTYAVASNS